MKYRYSFAGTNPVTQAIWKKITIQTVEGVIISGVVEENLPGNPSSTEQFSLNITKSGSSSAIEDFFFVPSNLTAGSIIPALNRNLTGTAVWLDHQIVYLTVWNGFASGMGNVTSQYYWDQRVGVLLEYSTLSDDVITTDIKLVESSMWGGGVDWSFWVIIIAIVAVAATATSLLILRRRKRLSASTALETELSVAP